MHKPIRTLVSSAVLGMMASATVQAGAFSLYTEGTGSAISNYAAGVAAEAADASTGWYNPAGLALLDRQQIVGGGVGVFPVTSVTGSNTYSTVVVPGVLTATNTEAFVSEDGAKEALVPSFHYANPVSENITLGFSLVSPFGLSTDWDRYSPMRYAATYSELLTVNASPVIGARINQNFAIGAGLDLQYARVKFNRVLGSPALLSLGGLPANLLDSESLNEGYSFGVGFHAGLMAMFNDNHTRVGFNYQSRVKHKFHGHSELTGILADPALANANSVYRTDNLYSNNIRFPDIYTLSAYHDVNEQWALLGSVVFTQWNVFDKIELYNVAAASPAGGNIQAVSIAEQNYDNAWRFALGANYKVNEQLMMRGGFGYDQTPTNDVDRDIRLPDADRWAVSLGAKYDINHEVAFELGYTYLWANKSTSINKVESIGTTSTNTLVAETKPYANLVGAQITWKMDQPVAVVATK